MRRMSIGLLALVTGCFSVTAPPVGRYVKLRPDTRPECEAMCREMGMRLGAVVLIQSSAGCVCEPGEGERGARSGAAAVASGEVLASMARAEQEASREREERERREAEERERQQRESVIPSP